MRIAFERELCLIEERQGHGLQRGRLRFVCVLILVVEVAQMNLGQSKEPMKEKRMVECQLCDYWNEDARRNSLGAQSGKKTGGYVVV